ncbi:protein CcmA, bactofilin family [Pseudoxanthomonas sp. CF125]|jgi:cytoskeletal protein CcmA (bactofilin family)|nr:protein CcmA, bactofilin family [Pseudoxanthomonas sp. CF125]
MFKNKPIHHDGHAIDTLIGPQVTIQGDLIFSGGLYVEGRIYGKVIAEEGERAVLTLAEQGRIEGEVQVPVVILNGQLQGDVYAAERVELAAKARVTGNVHYKIVEMRAGATLTGRLIHVDAETAAAPVATLVASSG